MRPGARIGCDFVEMKLHHVVSHREGECGRRPARGRSRRTGRRFIALVGGLPRPGSTPGPLPGLLVLLADPGLILEPDLDRRLSGRPFSCLQPAREIFLNASALRSSCLGEAAGAHMGEAQLMEELPDIVVRMERDAEPLNVIHLRSMGRRRTTPWFSRSGPASTSRSQFGLLLPPSGEAWVSRCSCRSGPPGPPIEAVDPSRSVWRSIRRSWPPIPDPFSP